MATVDWARELADVPVQQSAETAIDWAKELADIPVQQSAETAIDWAKELADIPVTQPKPAAMPAADVPTATPVVQGQSQNVPTLAAPVTMPAVKPSDMSEFDKPGVQTWYRADGSSMSTRPGNNPPGPEWSHSPNIQSAKIADTLTSLPPSRAGTDEVARKIPPQDWDSVLDAVSKSANEKKTFSTQGVATRAAAGLFGSLADVGATVSRWTGGALTDEQSRFSRRLLAAQQAADPIQNPEAPWYDPREWVVGAAKMYPQLALAGGAGKVAGVATKALGAGAKAVGLAGGAASAATFAPEMYENTYDALLEKNVAPSTARWAATASATIQSALFAGLPKALVPKIGGADVLTKELAENIAKQYVKTVLVHGPGVMAGSAAIDAAIQDVAKGKPPEVGKIIQEAGATYLHAIGPMAILAAPKAVVESIAKLPPNPSRSQFEKAGGNAGTSAKERQATVEAARDKLQQQQPEATEPVDPSRPGKIDMGPIEPDVAGRPADRPIGASVASSEPPYIPKGVEPPIRTDAAESTPAAAEAKPPVASPEQAGNVMPGPSIPIPVKQIPSGMETQSTGDVVKVLANAFDVPIRTGHFRRAGAVGIYKQLEKVVRTKGYGDISAASHEVAHHLSKTDEIFTKQNSSLTNAMRDELRSLDYKPNRNNIEEGFAEYVRHGLTMDDAATVAPQFDNWFRGTYLAGNKKAADAFSVSKGAIDTWREAGSTSRVIAQIDTESANFSGVKKILRNPKSIPDWITDNFFNRLAPLQKAAQEMVGLKRSYLNTRGVMEKMDADVNFWAFAKVSNMAAAAKVRAWSKFGTSDVKGNRTGPGLEEVLRPINADIRDPKGLDQFYAYCYARHAIDVHAQGKDPGISLADAQYVVKQFDTKPGWKDASNGLTNWWDSGVKYAVDAGALPQEVADIFRQMYPHYISLARKMDGDFATNAGGGGARYADLPTVTKRLKGSGREIIAPLESALSTMERMVSISDHVRVGRMLIEASEKYGKLGEMTEKVDPKSISNSTTMEALKKQLESAGADLSNADMDTTLTFFSQMVKGDPKDNIIPFYRNGKLEAHWVRSDLFRALMAYDKPYKLPEILDQTFGRIARTIRVGATGLRAGFSLITNPARDLQTALMQTEYQSKNPFSIAVNSARGFVSDITNDATARLWKSGGGEMGQPLAIDRRFTQEAVRDLIAQHPADKALNWMSHPIDTLREAFSISESAPRLAEVTAAWKKLGWKPGQDLTFEQYVKGQMAGMNVSVDFREGGNLAMWINRINPFFNANIQGPARMASALRNHPLATTANALLWITLPTVALWYKQKDEEWYKNLEPMERYRYWHVKIGSQILKVPKPFEWGHVFGSMVDGALESAYGENPKAFGEAFGRTIDDMTPPLVPGAIAPWTEIAANKNFFSDRPLVPERLKNLLPEDQIAPHTTETAKQIGKLFGISPIYVEHLASSYTGGLATDATRSIEQITGIGRTPTNSENATIPVAGRLFLRETHTRVINDFYEKLGSMEKEYNSAKSRKAIIPKSVSGIKMMRGTAEVLSKMREITRKILSNPSLSDEEKRKKFLELHVRMVQAASIANAKVNGKTTQSISKNIADLRKRLGL
jgi:hypothetical protein